MSRADSTITTAFNRSPPVIFGTGEITSPLVSVYIPNHEGFKYICCIVGIGWNGALNSITPKINEQDLPDGVESHIFLGTATQGIDSWLAAAITGFNVDYTDDGLNKAGFVLKIPKSANIAGFPRITALVDAGVASPIEYAAEFARSTIYGMGRTVDQSSVDAIKLINDEQIGGENRHTYSLVLLGGRSHDDILQDLAGHSAAFITDDGDQIVFIPDRPAISSGVINESKIQDLSIQRISDAPNYITIEFENRENYPYRSDRIIISDDDVNNGIIEKIEATVSAGAVTVKQAQRIGLRLLLESKLIKRKYQFTTPDEAIVYRVGAIVEFSNSRYGLTSRKIRILSIPEPSAGRYSVIAEDYNSEIYTDDINGVVVTYNKLEEIPDNISLPIINSVTTGWTRNSSGDTSYHLDVLITPPNTENLREVIVEAKQTGTDNWRRLPELNDSSRAQLENVKDQETWQVRAKSISVFSPVESEYTTLTSVTVDTANAPLDDPTSVTLTYSSNGSCSIRASGGTLDSQYVHTVWQYYSGGWQAGSVFDERSNNRAETQDISEGSAQVRVQRIGRTPGNASSWVNSNTITAGKNTAQLLAEKASALAAAEAKAAAEAADLAARRTSGVSFRDSANTLDYNTTVAYNKGSEGVSAATYSGQTFAARAPTIINDSLNSPVGNSRIIDVNGNKIAISSIVENRISGQLSDAKLASLSGWKLFGNSVDQAKIYGQLGDAKLSGLNGSKVTNDSMNASQKLIWHSITESKLGDDVVNERVVTANAIYAYHIVGGQITADKLAANAVTANLITAGRFNFAGGGFLDLDNSGGIILKNSNDTLRLLSNGSSYFSTISTPFFQVNTGAINMYTHTYFPSWGHIWVGGQRLSDYIDSKITAHESKPWVSGGFANSHMPGNT